MYQHFGLYCQNLSHTPEPSYVRLLIFTNTCTHRCNERITQNSLNDVEIDAKMADALNFDDFHKIVCISPNSASKNKFLGSILPQRVYELLPILVPMGSLTCNLRGCELVHFSNLR